MRLEPLRLILSVEKKRRPVEGGVFRLLCQETIGTEARFSFAPWFAKKYNRNIL